MRVRASRLGVRHSIQDAEQRLRHLPVSSKQGRTYSNQCSGNDIPTKADGQAPACVFISEFSTRKLVRKGLTSQRAHGDPSHCEPSRARVEHFNHLRPFSNYTSINIVVSKIVNIILLCSRRLEESNFQRASELKHVSTQCCDCGFVPELTASQWALGCAYVEGGRGASKSTKCSA